MDHVERQTKLPSALSIPHLDARSSENRPGTSDIQTKVRRKMKFSYAAYTPLMYRSTKSTPDFRNQSASFVAPESNNLGALSWKRQTNKMVDSMHHAISRFTVGPSI